MMRGFFIGLAALAFATPSLGASFDCNKAATPLEYAICGNPDLSKADESMARAFSALRAALSKPASAIVLDNQRRWNDYAARACTPDASPKTKGAYSEDDVWCLTELFDSRAYALEQTKPVDGLPVYSIDHFDAVPDPDPSSWSHTAKTVISYAQIDSDSPTAQGFNAFVRGIADPVLNAEHDPEFDATADYSLTLMVESATSTRISLIINEYFYGHGAAHGNYNITYRHYLTGDGRELVAEDIFDQPGWALALTPLVIARLKEDAAREYDEADAIWEDLDGLENAVGDAARWVIRKEGIGFQFQPYEVSAYAYGAPVAVMSWSELSPWLKPGMAKLLIGR